MIKKFNADTQIILKNFSYLTLLKFFNVGFKFFLVAYLIRVLGETNYGMVTWLDSIIQYFLMLINFGFNVYAAKYIISNKEQKDKIDQIVSTILIIKTLLFVFSLLAVIGLSYYQSFLPYQNLLILFIFTGIGEVLFPIWFYQGKENLRPATIIVFISRLLMVVGTIAFVNSEDDNLEYILILVLSSVLMGITGIGYALKNYNVRLVYVPIQTLVQFAKESFPFFLGRFLSLVFNFGTIYLIGEFCDFGNVAGFDLSLKVVMVCVIPFEMLQQAVFPTLSRTKDKRFLMKLLKGTLFVGLLTGVFLYAFSDTIIELVGGSEMISYASTLRVLSVLAPFVALTFILGSCSLVAFDFFKEYNFSLIATSIIYLIILVVLYLFGVLNFWNLVYLRVFGDVLMFAIRLYFSVKNNVVNFTTN